MDDVSAFSKLIEGGYSCISIVTHEEFEALDVIRRAAKKLEYEMRIWSLGLGMRDGHNPIIPPNTKLRTVEAGLLDFSLAPRKTVCVALDLAPLLSSTLALRALRDTIHRVTMNKSVLVLLDTEDKLPDVIKSYARSYELSLPTEMELDLLVRSTVREIYNVTPLEIGITKDGLAAMIRNLRGLSSRQARQLIYDITVTDKRLEDSDVNKIIAGKRRLLQSDGLLEYVEAPLTMEEIGGMNHLKEWLRLRKNAFSEKAVQFGLTPPRGVLMLGVQGAGKSLCAKAIATAWQQPLYRLDCGTLYNSYIGESERRLRDALRQAEMMAPIILWIDEIEKAFSSAASRSTDGGLSQAMFGSPLTWVQGQVAPGFLVATANDIEALPPELLRKGRFDEIFFVDLPAAGVREQIFGIHLKKRGKDAAEFDLKALAAAADGFSGAEIEQAVISALHTAYSSHTQPTTEMIVEALRASPPLSVTMAERVAALRNWATRRCVPAD